MEQHPQLTLAWALHSLEVALRNLEDGPAEQRVRRQFHQLLLAVERHTPFTEDLSPAGYVVPPIVAQARR